MLAALALGLVLTAPTTVRIYHLGNSVTDTLRAPALSEMATQRGHTYTFGRQMIPGAPLSWLYEHPTDGFTEAPFGHYPEALGGFEWDVLTLQPFDRHLEGPDGDLAMGAAFIELLRERSPEARVLVYSRWPRRAEDGSLDYAAAWARTYTGGWDGTNESRDYFLQVLAGLRDRFPEMEIDLVPVGEVLLELDRAAQEGELPGLTSAVDLYVDGIHFGDLGSFVVGTVFYAVVFREDPTGLDSAPYGDFDSELVTKVQELVWRVVRSDPETGVEG